jgi:hypothetical protein
MCIYVFCFISRFDMFVKNMILKFNYMSKTFFSSKMKRGRGGHARMVVGFTTTCAISAYRHLS